MADLHHLSVLPYGLTVVFVSISNIPSVTVGKQYWIIMQKVSILKNEEA
jgi:hypothetical protein